MTAREVAGLALGYLAGAVPFSYLIARVWLGVDLRTVGTGTATPTNLRRVGGLRPALVAGAFEIAKGAVGPLIVGREHLFLAALAGALAVVGHNWSPLLRGGGGRGISTVTGALAVVAWPGALFLGGWLAAGIIAGRLTRPGPRPHPLARFAANRGPGGPSEPPFAANRARERDGGRVLPAMRVGVFLLLPFLAVVDGLHGLIVGAILVAPIGFKTVHEINRRQLLRRVRP